MTCENCSLRRSCDPELCANELLAEAHRLPNGQKDEWNRRRQATFEEEMELGLACIPHQLQERVLPLFHV